MVDPEEMVSRLPAWLRIAAVGLLVVLASGAALVGYRYFSEPATFTVAAGSYDGEALRIMQAITARLANGKSAVRLKIVDTGTIVDAAKAFAAGSADLAIVRADADNLSAARTVVLLTHAVVMVIAAAGSGIESMDELKGKMIGVVGGEGNRAIINLLTREYDLGAKTQFKPVAPANLQQALRSKQVNAVLLVIPLADKYLSLVRNLFAGNGKQKPALIPIESAGAIENVAKAYESYDLPKGTVRGSPPIPDDDLTTLRVPLYLVANRKLSDDTVAALTKAVMEARHELLGDFPVLAQVMAPSTDKDAFIPVHPGAAAYFDGTQQGFFEKYSDALYYGPMLLGGLASFLVALYRFVGGTGGEKTENALAPLYALAKRIREARSEAELARIEEDLDAILQSELSKYAGGTLQPGDAAALSLAAHRLEHLMDYRRHVLVNGGTPVATAQADLVPPSTAATSSPPISTGPH